MQRVKRQRLLNTQGDKKEDKIDRQIVEVSDDEQQRVQNV